MQFLYEVFDTIGQKIDLKHEHGQSEQECLGGIVEEEGGLGVALNHKACAGMRRPPGSLIWDS